MRQLKDGKAHPLWLLGHLANSSHVTIHMWACGGAPLIPFEYNKMFSPDTFGGDPITAVPADYPAWDEVLANYEKVSETCLEELRGLSDDDLSGELPGKVPDSARDFLGNIESTLRIMAIHDAHHRGQISLLAALGG